MVAKYISREPQHASGANHSCCGLCCGWRSNQCYSSKYMISTCMRPHATKDRQELVPSQVCVPDGTNHVPQPLCVPIFVQDNTPSSPEGASIHSTSQLAAGLGKWSIFPRENVHFRRENGPTLPGKWSILVGKMDHFRRGNGPLFRENDLEMVHFPRPFSFGQCGKMI